MNKTISPKITALTFGVLVICFAIAFYVVAWQEPSQVPPGGNVPTPLNVGPTGQSKSGGLILNTGGAVNGLIIDKGNLCLGSDCRSSWPGGGIPSGMIAMFDTSCPSGWTRFAALDNRFPIGASSYGETGGSTSHSHSYGGTTASVGHTHRVTGGTFMSGYAFDDTSHAHTYSGNVSPSSNIPPYLNVVWCKKN